MSIEKVTEKIATTIAIVGSIVFLGGCLAILGIFMQFAISDYQSDLKWKETLTPLHPDTVNDLCDVFELNWMDRRCKLSKKVYRFEFYGEVYGRFYYDLDRGNASPLSFDEVEALIGQYNQGCNEDYEESYCWYDFSGTNEDPIILFFDENGILDFLHSRHLD